MALIGPIVRNDFFFFVTILALAALMVLFEARRRAAGGGAGIGGRKAQSGLERTAGADLDGVGLCDVVSVHFADYGRIYLCERYEHAVGGDSG